MREIGTETEGLFKFNLETWLSINMPYYNKLFESELMVFDPLTNTKEDTTIKKVNDKTQSSTSTSNASGNATNKQNVDSTVTEDDFSRHLESTNPDSRLAITTNDGKGVIEYASQIQENTDKNNRTSGTSTSSNSENTDQVSAEANGVINETEDYIQSKIGKIGDQSYSKMMNEYRQSLIRIERQIFQEMQELFMLVY
jgi:hypothetical protein